MTVPLARGRRFSRLIVALPAACALALPAGVAAPALARAVPPPPFPPFPSLVSNGGFEIPWRPGSTQINSGGTIGAWRVTGGSVDLVGANSFWPAFKGRQSVDLTGSRPGTIQQIISTSPGRCYTVSYALAGNTYGNPVIKRGYARVTQGMLNVQSNFAFNAAGKSPRNMGYVRQSFVFCSRGPWATLRFTSTTGGVYGPVIDDVIVTPRLPGSITSPDVGSGGVNDSPDIPAPGPRPDDPGPGFPHGGPGGGPGFPRPGDAGPGSSRPDDGGPGSSRPDDGGHGSSRPSGPGHGSPRPGEG